MRKEKNTGNTSEKHTPIIRMIEVPTDQTNLEMEIDRQVKTLRALINKLRPRERQQYFDGLLSHMLSQPIDYPNDMTHINDSYDYCNLSVDELSLIRELSVKVHELYRISENDS